MSKRSWLPTSKGIDLFPKVIQAPTRLVIRGVPSDDPRYNDIAEHFSGRLKQFHAKAQQAHALSVNNISMTRANWGDGRAIYTNIQGHENLELEVDLSMFGKKSSKKESSLVDLALIYLDYPSDMWGVTARHVAYLAVPQVSLTNDPSVPGPYRSVASEGTAYTDDGTKQPVLSFPPSDNTHVRYVAPFITITADGSQHSTLLIDATPLGPIPMVVVDIYAQLLVAPDVNATCQIVDYSGPFITNSWQDNDAYWNDGVTHLVGGAGFTFYILPDAAYGLPAEGVAEYITQGFFGRTFFPFWNYPSAGTVAGINGDSGIDPSIKGAVFSGPGGRISQSWIWTVDITAVGDEYLATNSHTGGTDTCQNVQWHLARAGNDFSWTPLYDWVQGGEVDRPVEVKAQIIYRSDELGISTTSGGITVPGGLCSPYNLSQGFTSWELAKFFPRRPVDFNLGSAVATSTSNDLGGAPLTPANHFGQKFLCRIIFDREHRVLSMTTKI